MKLITILSTAQFNLLILQSRCMIIHFLSCQSFPIWHYSCRCECCACLFIYMSRKWTFSTCGTWCRRAALFFFVCFFFRWSRSALSLHLSRLHLRHGLRFAVGVLPSPPSWDDFPPQSRGPGLTCLGWYRITLQANLLSVVYVYVATGSSSSCFFNPLWMAVSAGRLDPG